MVYHRLKSRPGQGIFALSKSCKLSKFTLDFSIFGVILMGSVQIGGGQSNPVETGNANLMVFGRVVFGCPSRNSTTIYHTGSVRKSIQRTR